MKVVRYGGSVMNPALKYGDLGKIFLDDLLQINGAKKK